MLLGRSTTSTATATGSSVPLDVVGGEVRLGGDGAGVHRKEIEAFDPERRTRDRAATLAFRSTLYIPSGA